jgi:hypothetical protein
MPCYKFHAVPHHGERTDGRDILCDDDGDALLLAETMVRGYASIEVWLDAALVGAVHPSAA